MTERYKTTMKDWYHYHDTRAKGLKDKESLTLLEKTLLAESEYWIKELESQILTSDEALNDGNKK